MNEGRQGGRAARRKAREAESVTSGRSAAYWRLRHPFAPQGVFSEDEVAAMHETAFRVLEELGIRMLLPEAREILRKAGAQVDEDTLMARIGRDIVEEALKTAPRSWRMRSPTPARELTYEPGAMLFGPGAGCPNVTDRERGRRPGDLQAFEETIKLQHAFEAIHILGPSAEPQDVPVHLRHYAMMETQMRLSDKPLFVYSRGTRQVEEAFEMIRIAHDLDEAEFRAGTWVKTIINSNSPRQLDAPMGQGVIDFARAGQMCVITPFCLSGAMAPITTAGALTLQHAEALACIALSQLAGPGAPVSYGSFSSNVDMKSGAPAFGSPEHVKATLGAGQLARHIGMPWRAATGSAANLADAQAAQETAMALWACVLAGATVTLHAAGWLEGGLSFGYEKFITDVEGLNTIAELCAPPPGDADAIGFDAIAEVEPGGHFFAAAHTMERYEDAFYPPFVADLSNFGSWSEAGGLSTEERATGIWKRALDEFEPPKACEGVAERLAPYIAERKAAGGAPVLE